MTTTYNEALPKDLGLWFHPHLNWQEKILSNLINRVMGLKAWDGSSQLATARQHMEGHKTSNSILNKWATLAHCPLAVAEGQVPFRSNILNEWGISSAKIPSIPEDRTSVGVRVMFPSKLLKENAAADDDSLEIDESTGCVLVDFATIDWKTFAPQVPVILQFHGGGMVIGQANDTLLTEEAFRVAETAKNMDLSSSSNNNDVITVSVDYALAPEYPFPTAVIDALSVLEVLSDRHSLHVSGMSAGANLALVAGMEGFRKYGHVVKSIHANSPFVDPAADTLSYYTNQGVYPSIQWLRWCWQAYLKLDVPSNNNDDDDKEDSGGDKAITLLRKGSNHTTWKQWKEAHPSLARLVNPVLELPPNLGEDDAPLLVINRYNLGDPLHSDGEMVAQALKKTCSKTAHSFESIGLHCDALGPYDPKAPQEYWKLWARAIFGGGGGK